MIVSDRQMVSLRTYDGIQLYQFLSNDQIDLSWGYESREVSSCKISVPTHLDYNRLPDLIPWDHWIDVWDDSGMILYWSGPIQRVASDRQVMNITAKDIGCFRSRTRNPMTKRWDAADPADIARELDAAMIRHHNLRVDVITRRDPLGDKFDFSVLVDDQMLDRTFDDLVDMGMYWTVVSGTMVLGPVPREPVVSLGERDFVSQGMTVIRDGSETFNDVLVKGADAKMNAIVPMGRQRLQTIKTIDNMFAVSNVERAAKQYARYSAAIKDTVSLPDGAVLDADAPVTLEQLTPSTRFTLDAYGMLLKMELSRVDVRCTSSGTTVGVGLNVVDDDLPELVKLENKESISGFDQGLGA